MPIHPAVKEIYIKYYEHRLDANMPDCEDFMAATQLDSRFLEEVSRLVYTLENLLS